MTRGIRMLPAGVLPVVIATVSCHPFPQPTPQTLDHALQLPVLAPDTSRVSRLVANGACNPLKPGTSMAILSWVAAERVPRNQRIDVAVSKPAFGKGVYATFWPLDSVTRLRAITSTPAWNESRGRRFDLTVTGFAADSQASGQGVTIERLEPGLDYSWRVLVRTAVGWVPSQTVRFQAPICVADVLERQ